jgi:hypothetical protein
MPQTGLGDPTAFLTTGLVLTAFAAAVVSQHIRRLKKVEA